MNDLNDTTEEYSKMKNQIFTHLRSCVVELFQGHYNDVESNHQK